jgi:hypothetical protein
MPRQIQAIDYELVDKIALKPDIIFMSGFPVRYELNEF